MRQQQFFQVFQGRQPRDVRNFVVVKTQGCQVGGILQPGQIADFLAIGCETVHCRHFNPGDRCAAGLFQDGLDGRSQAVVGDGHDTRGKIKGNIDPPGLKCQDMRVFGRVVQGVACDVNLISAAQTLVRHQAGQIGNLVVRKVQSLELRQAFQHFYVRDVVGGKIQPCQVDGILQPG